MAKLAGSTALEDLANTIAETSTAVCSFLKKHDLPQPSFDADGPQRFPAAPPEIVKARADLVMAARKLQYLALWPADSIMWHSAIAAFDTATLHWLVHFGIFDAVPLEGSIRYEDIASTCQVPVADLERYLRHAMTNNWFYEPEVGRVAHSSISYLVVTNEASRGQLLYNLEINFPTTVKVVESAESGRTEGASEPPTAFNLAFKTEKNSAQWAAEDPDWARTYSNMMTNFIESPAFGVKHIVDGYKWNELGAAHVVDVGGNTGPASIALARQYSDLRLTVQDLPEPISIGRSKLPLELKDGIDFQVQNFLEPNKAQDVDVFLLRFVLHDWPDTDAERILRNLLPACKPQTKILIFDIVAQSSSVTGLQEKMARHMDVLMMAMFGAKERSEEQWRALIQRADASLRIRSITRPIGCAASLIELSRQ